MATPPKLLHRFRNTRVSRFLQARWRLVFATLLGVALYLILVVTMIVRSAPDRVRNDSSAQDDGRIAIPILTVIAGMASLGAIIFWLRTASESQDIQPRILALLFLTTLLSWLFVHTMFALHYAHEYYAEHRGKGGGMRFPGGGKPNYWTSSISPSSSAPRRRYRT